jgi:hypothetical protein
MDVPTRDSYLVKSFLRRSIENQIQFHGQWRYSHKAPKSKVRRHNLAYRSP